MNILLYYQNPYHTVFLESLVQGFIEKGHTVFFLTTCPEGILHKKMKDLGASIHTFTPQKKGILMYFFHWRYLIRFCRQNKINIVYSHLQFANLIAVMARFFIKGTVLPCRHHANDVVLRGNKNALRMDKLVNRFSKKIIVVSNAVKKQMTDHESVKPGKIEVIRLGYNFDLYNKPEPEKVLEIKNKLNAEFILIVIGRMTKNKKHITAIEAFDMLVKKGMNLKMILMDEGPEEKNIHELVKRKDLNDKIIFTGFLSNTMNYLACADLLINPSVSEASNQVVKEAALLNIPSIVCRGVGDFEEYIVHEKNGFLVNPENAAVEIAYVVEKCYTDRKILHEMGQNIHSEVLSRFDIKQITKAYLSLAVYKKH